MKWKFCESAYEFTVEFELLEADPFGESQQVAGN